MYNLGPLPETKINAEKSIGKSIPSIKNNLFLNMILLVGAK